MLTGGFFSGESLGLCCGCWPTLLTLWVEGEEPLRQGRPECPFLQVGEVLGKLLSFVSGVSEVLMLDVLGLTSPGLTPFSVAILHVELKVLAEKAVASSDFSSSAEGLSGEACPEFSGLLALQSDTRGQGIELLFKPPLFVGDDTLERGTAGELTFPSVITSLLSSSVFVLKG